MRLIVFQLLLFALPWQARRFLLQLFLNFQIDRSARIGYSIVLSRQVKLCANSRIGHLCMVKGLSLLRLGENATIGNLNWITAFPEGASKHFAEMINRRPSLVVGNHSAITNRHLIDCTDRFEIGEFTTIAGFRSQFLTHSIDLATNKQACKPIKIGDYCFVGTAVTILGGAVLPNSSVLGAMSFLATELTSAGYLYAGVPAKPLGEIAHGKAYFSRASGFVW